MKRLQAKRSRRSSHAELLRNGDSTKALRRKLSKLEESVRVREKLTAPKFLKELQEKEDFYYFNLRLFKAGAGQRFSRDIIRDPVFRAIRYCRERTWQTKLLEIIKSHPESDFIDAGITPLWAKGFKLLSKHPPQRWIEPYDPGPERLLASEFLTAINQGDIPRLEALVKLCKAHEMAFSPPRQRASDSKRWHYYAAYAARYFLEEGLLPNKKAVKDLAFITRAGAEFPFLKIPPDRAEQQWEQKMEQLHYRPKPNWTRIFHDLGLEGLPSAPTHPRL